MFGDGQSLLASEPVAVFSANGTDPRNPFDLLQEQIRLHPTCTAIGYFGYDLKNCLERLPATAPDDLGLPDCWFGFYDNLHVFDHAARQLGHDRSPGLEKWKNGRMEVARGTTQSSNLPTFQPSAPLSSNFTRATYREAIHRAKEYIAAGDIYQVNLSQRFQCAVPAGPVEVYLGLCAANPAPYAAYLDIGDAQILSSSPECFLQIRGRQVVTRPIKGTRPRGCDAAEDRRIADELLHSPKDNAELVMITDLERNDLGKVCEYGSVHTRELVRVEQFATVHHLVSTVAGTLREGVSHVDCVRACFPGGSITGAPKIRAMQIIDEIEPHARGPYCGAIGFITPEGISQFNIAIRTVVYQSRPPRGSDFQSRPESPPTIADEIRSHEGASGRLTFHAGGGIVADSEPDAEYDETLAKAQGILNAIDQLRVR